MTPPAMTPPTMTPPTMNPPTATPADQPASPVRSPGRRGVLLGAAAASAAACAAGAVAVPEWRYRRAAEAASGPAFTAWADPARLTGAARIAAQGILAPSPHNTQPWAIGISGNDIDLFAVPSRNLGAFDPFRREMTIGLGAALEQMVQAAGLAGRDDAVSLLPDGRQGLRAARLRLVPGLAPAPLAAAITTRRTNRFAYDPANWPAETILAALRACTDDPALTLSLFAAGSAAGQRLADTTLAATGAIVADAGMMAASQSWTRPHRIGSAAAADGLDLAGSGLSPWLLMLARLLPPRPAEEEGGYWLAMTRDQHLPSAAGFGVISVAELGDRAAALAVGRLWARLHLTAASLGLAVQPLNQIPEMIDRDRELGRPATWRARVDGAFAAPGLQPSFVFRFGYCCQQPPPSPRRGLALVLRPA